ncbi:MAG: hypothetical protein GVY24_07005 [Planctomycetes bacterium]|jgi:hypothetical protein|nr:hypothetical protein [Planctomycetota bacterium]
MATKFDEDSYAQRWHSETVMFMLKQRQGEALTARKHHTRRRGMALRCIAHNINDRLRQRRVSKGHA